MQQLPSQVNVMIAETGPTGLTHTLEVLEPLGVTPTSIAEGVKMPIFRVRDRGTTLLTLDFKEITSASRF